MAQRLRTHHCASCPRDVHTPAVLIPVPRRVVHGTVLMGAKVRGMHISPPPPPNTVRASWRGRLLFNKHESCRRCACEPMPQQHLFPVRLMFLGITPFNKMQNKTCYGAWQNMQQCRTPAHADPRPVRVESRRGARAEKQLVAMFRTAAGP